MNWNHTLFLALNASVAPRPAMLVATSTLAASPVFVVPLLLVALWISGRALERAGLIVTTLGIGLALIIAHIEGFAWYEPRPFMIDLGHTWVSHPIENAFPSDHATLMWSLALGLALTRVSANWAMACLVWGATVAWARIYLGLHFPIDMAGAAVAAVAGTLLALPLRSPVERWISPHAEWIYSSALRSVSWPFRR
jgi:undecaprenyl-diphosphatase